uniref:HTH_38 domain-containing protein n=1 Tax=Heterorhabditis bacteriophora TaxID=37862 RepID=A0A1I7WET0_HETBA
MGRVSTLSLHERGRIKVLSTTGHTVKQIADVVKRSRKTIMNFLRHQEEYGTKKSTSNSTISVNEIRRSYGIDASKTTVWRMLNKCPNTARSRMKKWTQLTQLHKNGRLCFA